MFKLFHLCCAVLEFVLFMFKKAPERLWDCCLRQQAMLLLLSAWIRLRLRFSLRCNKSISSSVIRGSPPIVHGCVLIETDTSLSAFSGDAELKQSSWHVPKSGNPDVYWRCSRHLIAPRKPGPQCLSWKGLWSVLEERFPDLHPLVSSLWWLITASQEEPPSPPTHAHTHTLTGSVWLHPLSPRRIKTLYWCLQTEQSGIRLSESV